MTAADVELARMIYLASTLGSLLFASMLLRGLWRPLRFLLLAWLLSFFCTPYFVAPDMPDGSKQNIVPAFVVALHEAANDRDNWRQVIVPTMKPIALVAAITSVFALLLAWLLPKPARRSKNQAPATHKQHNPYLPEDFQPQ